MSRLRRLLAAFFITVAMGAATAAADPENTLLMDLKSGRVVIEMRPDLAPKHVSRIKELVRQGFYNGLKWHRVIDGFMAQGGDPDGRGTGGSGQNIPAEFSAAPFRRGAVGMARSGNDPNSADSQFFICFGDAEWLNGQYTLWGQVTAGMEHVDAIKRGRGQSGTVTDPDVILRLRVATDEG